MLKENSIATEPEERKTQRKRKKKEKRNSGAKAL